MSVLGLLLRNVRKNVELFAFKKRFRKKFPGTFINPMNVFDIDRVDVGKYSYGELNVMMWTSAPNSLTIGRFVSIAPEVTFILGGNHPYDAISTYPFSDFIVGGERDGDLSKGAVTIGDDVWIGTKSTILSGLTIGQGSIVAAGSLVTRDVPPYSIVGGNPAKVIKYRFPEEMIPTLLQAVRYDRLSDEKIRNNIALLKQPVSPDNLSQLVSLFS